ncbi:MAG: transposase [Candidatus Hydrogenedentes bacterium]|nr:transposase [Candidatus Hydrogenedentota bacterium]
MPQSLARIHVHIVFSTKARTPFLRNTRLRADLHAYLAEAYRGQECPVTVVGGADDHVHILCIMSKNRPLADVIRDTKRSASKWLKGRPGGAADFRWQQGYGAFSVSHSNVTRVRRYIAEQEEHHKAQTFQEEFRALLERHGLECDDRYVWD